MATPVYIVITIKVINLGKRNLPNERIIVIIIICSPYDGMNMDEIDECAMPWLAEKALSAMRVTAVVRHKLDSVWSPSYTAQY